MTRSGGGALYCSNTAQANVREELSATRQQMRPRLNRISDGIRHKSEHYKEACVHASALASASAIRSAARTLDASLTIYSKQQHATTKTGKHTMTISPELQAKIDALPFEYLKEGVIRMLTDPARQHGTDEQVFSAALNDYLKSLEVNPAERAARMYRWRKDEVLAFIEHFKKQEPQKYDEYLQQERNGRQLDADLWRGDVATLAEQWRPGLDDDDYSDLLGLVRDYAVTHLI